MASTWTSTDLASIEAAILALASGEAVRRVYFSNGHSIEYQEADLDRLMKVRATIARELGDVHRRVYAGNGGRCRS
ncbi:MAG: hypothetical protein WCS59_06625 [Sphaerochaetaceae bacterium]|jgi:hypothetical protein